MPKLRIAIVTVVALAILCLAFVVATSKRAPVLTVRVLEVDSAGGRAPTARPVTAEDRVRNFSPTALCQQPGNRL